MTKGNSVELSLNSRVSYHEGYKGKAAFILDYDRERDFDAGVSYMFALLGSVSMWNGTGSQLASCPKQESLYFGIMADYYLTENIYAGVNKER